MAQWCDSCGQKLPDGEVPADATWLGTPDEDHQHTFAKPAGAKKSGSDKRLLQVVGAAVLVWVAFVGIGRLTSPADTIDEQAAADIEQARVDEAAKAAVEAARAEAEAEAANIAEVEGDYEAADAAPGFPDADSIEPEGDQESGDSNLGARVAVSVQVERLQRQLARRSSTAFVAYLSRDEDVVLVDLVSGRAQVAEGLGDIAGVQPGARLLRSETSTIAIDPDTLLASQVGAGSSVVVSDAIDGNAYFVDAKSLSGQSAIVEVVADGEYGFHRMPAGGLQLHPVDGLGLLAVPKGPTGQTLIAGAESFSVLSENRVLTGTDRALLEQVCESESSCSLVITDLATNERIDVPPTFVRFGDQYVLAPDGRSLLRYSPEGFAEVFGADTGSIAWVVGAGMRAPAWGPNSDFIVWLDRIGDPKLKVMFTDEPDWLTIDLRDLGASPPLRADLIVFTPTTPAEAG